MSIPVKFAISAVFLAIGLIGLAATKKGSERYNKKRHRLFLFITIFALWFAIGNIIILLTSIKGGMHIEFNLFSERITLLGISFAETTVVSFGIIGIVLILALIFRFICFPKFKSDEPKGLQNLIEIAVEATDNFARNSLCDYSDTIAPYMFALAVYMIFCAISELFGLRPPTSDLLITFAMGFLSFILINYYGFKKKGFKGRMKKYFEPTPLVFPMKILSDLAVPVSLACRLFGNMLGGMIVMHLLKSVLGGYAIGLPPIAGLYFNVFHPLIQAYIFVILSLTFINESIE